MVESSVTEIFSKLRDEIRVTQTKLKAGLDETLKSCDEMRVTQANLKAGLDETLKSCKDLDSRISALENSSNVEIGVGEKAKNTPTNSLDAKVGRLEVRMEDVVTAMTALKEPLASQRGMARHSAGGDYGATTTGDSGVALGTVAILQSVKSLISTAKDQSSALGVARPFHCVHHNPMEALATNSGNTATTNVGSSGLTKTSNVNLEKIGSDTITSMEVESSRVMEPSNAKLEKPGSLGAISSSKIDCDAKTPGVGSLAGTSYPASGFVQQHKFVSDEVHKRGASFTYHLADKQKFDTVGEAKRFLENKLELPLKKGNKHKTAQGMKEYLACGKSTCRFSAFYNQRTKELYVNQDHHDGSEHGQALPRTYALEKDDEGNPIKVSTFQQAMEHFVQKHNGKRLKVQYRSSTSVTFACFFCNDCRYRPRFMINDRSLHDDVDGHDDKAHSDFAEKEEDIEMDQSLDKEIHDLASTQTPAQGLFGSLLPRYPTLKRDHDKVGKLLNVFKRVRHEQQSKSTGVSMLTVQDLKNWSNEQREQFNQTLGSIRRWRMQYEQVKRRDDPSIEQILVMADPHRFRKTKCTLSGDLSEILMAECGWCVAETESTSNRLAVGATNVGCLLNFNRALYAPGQAFGVLAADCAHQFIAECQYMLICALDAGQHGHMLCNGFVTREGQWAYETMMRKCISFAMEIHDAFGVPLADGKRCKQIYEKKFVGIGCDGELAIDKGISYAAKQKNLAYTFVNC